MEAESPNGRVIKLTGDGTYNAQFTPDEIGQNLFISESEYVPFINISFPSLDSTSETEHHSIVSYMSNIL